ncbi:hypothetical protein SLS62_004572 [Diatrype stigma]|uniref:Erythromycin esterase n=1 Tax=Diatrype stigma TaxID=117547 RepID=A0AAN9YT12_9PEZI
MATPKRRSARLASAQRVTASPAPQLDSIVEHVEQGEPSAKMKQKQIPVASSPIHTPSTPATATPVKLPMSEMHPSKVHPTMAPPSSGLRLGFVDIHPNEKSKNQPSGVTQTTPSKTPLPASAFSFRLDSELDLGPEARNIMDTLRGETARIKAELAAKREQERSVEAEIQGRRIAQAKGKASRYSAVHMAEFKKMDSIENHPSAYRANPDRITPLKAGTKRSQSKADLEEPDSARSSKVASVRPPPKTTEKRGDEQESRIKRPRQRFEDDASTTRPISRDGSAIPRPKTSGIDSVRGIPRSQTHSTLMTPTKTSLIRANSAKTPTMTLVKSPSKPEFKSATGTPTNTDMSHSKLRVDVSGLLKSSSKRGFGGLTKSHTTSNLLDSRNAPTHIQTPGRFGRVKSILKRQIGGTKAKNDSEDVPATSKTPGPQVTDKELPPLPLTTPGRKLAKRVEFTPQTKVVAAAQDSPSPTKSGIPRSNTLSKIPTSHGRSPNKAVNVQESEGEVKYPDLSAHIKDLGGELEKSLAKPLPPTSPNTFTFRSDHTIKLDDQAINGFGGAAGQASLRYVRDSNLFGSQMPGSFPRLPDVPKTELVKENKENKENADPQTTPTYHRDSKAAATSLFRDGIAHGMSNKKRSRATPEDEKDEGAERGAKKQRKNPTGVPEGDALLAPRLASNSPSKKPTLSSTPSPRKKGGLSLSRLNMLARPKIRK